jgi:hypothetical protein
LRVYSVNDLILCTFKEEEERHYLATRQQLLDQSAADEKIAKDLLKESLQVSVNLFLMDPFCMLNQNTHVRYTGIF